jgi:Calcium-activated BK potassium channel alpha subunit
VLGRFAAMSYVFMAVTLIPSMTTQLVEKMNKDSIYARSSFKLKANSKHIIVCGDLKSTVLSEFFQELFHEDHENLNLMVVVMLPEPPSPAMMVLLTDSLYSMNIFYLEGSVLNENDLVRARADVAIGIFIMTNKNTTNIDEEDAKTILQHFSVKRFSYANATSGKNFCYPNLTHFNQNCRNLTQNKIVTLVSVVCCLQIIRSENMHHIHNLQDGSDGSEKDMVICVNEIKMGLIAKSIIFPGVNTLVFNLLTSFADNNNEDDDDVKKTTAGTKNVIDSLEFVTNESWVDEYRKGCDWEVYTTELADEFVGIKFQELAYSLYLKLNILLIGLRVEEREGKQISRILINPGLMRIPSNTEFIVEGIVIAKNQKSSDLTFENNFLVLSQISLSAKSMGSTVTAESIVHLNEKERAKKSAAEAQRRKSSAANLMSNLGRRFSRLVGVSKKVARVSKNVVTTFGNFTINEEERKHHAEDVYFTRNYFHRPVPVLSSSVTGKLIRFIFIFLFVLL